MPFIGDKLLVIRKKKDLSMEDFAAIFGLSRPTYTLFEKNQREANREELFQFANALNLEERDLINDTSADNLTSERKVGMKVLSSKPDTGTPGGYVKRKIPLYDAIAVGGNSMLADQTPLSEPIDEIDPGDLLRAATGMLRVYGHSMYPKYPAGCMVAFKVGTKAVPDVIVWGEDYVIELEDRRILKKVDKGDKGWIKAVSYNTNNPKYVYDTIDIEIKDVKRMYMVLGKVEMEASI